MTDETVMSSYKQMLLNAYVAGTSNRETGNHTQAVEKTTMDIIDDMMPMARYTQDEVNAFMADAAYRVERRHGELKWVLYREPIRFGDEE